MTRKNWRYCRRCVYAATIGYNHYRICDFLGRTGHCRGCSHGIGCTRFSPVDGAAIFQLWWAGLIDGDIARKLRCSRGAVTRWRHLVGLPANTKPNWYINPQTAVIGKYQLALGWEDGLHG